jgi:hypothetical protein
MMDRLLAIAMREGGLVQRFFMLVRLIALRGSRMYDGARPFRDALRLGLPWAPPVNCSQQYAEKTECGLVTIAQFGNYSLADRRTLSLREDSVGRRAASRGGRY